MNKCISLTFKTTFKCIFKQIKYFIFIKKAEIINDLRRLSVFFLFFLIFTLRGLFLYRWPARA